MSDSGFRRPVGFRRPGIVHYDGAAVDVSVDRGPYCIRGTRIFVIGGMFTGFAFSAILVCRADGSFLVGIISGFALMIWRISPSRECTTGSARQKAVDLLFGRRKA